MAALKVRKSILALGFLTVILLFGLCEDSSAQTASRAEILITIERTACFGSCPIYRAEIYTDGTVVYKGAGFVKVEGEKRHKIPQIRIEMLIEEFKKADYFALKDKYETDENGMSVTDLPTTITSISLNGKRKKVVNYFGAPSKLEKLEDEIERLADLLDYTGPA